MMNRCKILLLISCIFNFVVLSNVSFALTEGNKNIANREESSKTMLAMSSQEMQELLLFFDESELIVTATKHPQKVSEAPAVAAVITAEEIRQMGARDIVDVLKRIPGFGVTKGYYGKEEIEVRGLKTANSEKVKLLIDGHSVNDNLSGGAVWGFDSLTVDNVKRIEVIRGPGSALYGSNAFSAVINVVTKDAKDIDGIILTGAKGSFETDKVNLQAGKTLNGVDVTLALDYLRTEGAKLKIDQDLIGHSGYTKNFENKLDGSFKAAWNDFSVSTKYVKRSRGVYLGASYILNDQSENSTEQYFIELDYKHSFNDETKLITKLYYDKWNWATLWEMYPRGTPGFPDGMLGKPSVDEYTYGGELQFDQELFKDNVLTFGLTAEKRASTVGYLANFNPVTGAPLPSTALQDVKSIGSWNKDTFREIYAAYAQDVWNVNKDVSLTIGLRHDQYSDFGSTTNPRGALVWKFWDKFDLKLLYGEAFRAPSFEELYNINNPVVIGNKDLKPEKMKTYEASLGFTSSHAYTSRVTYFKNFFDENIVPKLNSGVVMFENSGGAVVQGIEYEMKREFGRDEYYYINYTYQDAKDKETHIRLPDVPTHKGNVGGNVGLTHYLNANLNLFISGERPRADGDTRTAMPSFALVDLTLIGKNFYPNIEIRASVHNLLDQRYSDPAPNGTIPGDFPREGSSYMLEAFYKF